MSMVTLTIIQTTMIFILYTTLTCGVPFFLFNSRLRDFRLVVRLMMSFMIGNFYIMNLVFLLQLAHISNRFTLLAGTIIPAFLFYLKTRQRSVADVAGNVWNEAVRMSRGELGMKRFALNLAGSLKKLIGSLIRKCTGKVKQHPLDFCFSVGLLVCLIWMYGSNLLENFGYGASDLTVHNYWINSMSEGTIFVAGVYPFGFHCILYYLHAVFGIETYVLLRVFCLTQTIMIHFMLLFFLKACARSRYLPYAAVLVYVISDFFTSVFYLRYASTLPQEFGMIFVLPAVYFGFAYFEYQKKELEDESCPVRSKWCLAGFAMSFSMTLAVHFYGTMIAGLFCVAMAVGYLFRLFRKPYFKRVVLTCLLSVGIAVFPMAFAYATGTPLQGSLNWGMNIITGGSSDSDAEEEDAPGTEEDSETGEISETGETSETGESSETEATSGTEESSESGEISGTEGLSETKGVLGVTAASDSGLEESGTGKVSLLMLRLGSGLEGFAGRLSSIRWKVWSITNRLQIIFRSSLKNYIFSENNSIFYMSVLVSEIILFVMSAVFFILKENDYAARLFSTALFMVFLIVLLSAGYLGLPQLMDSSRASLYYCYCLPVLWCMAADSVLTLVFGRIRNRRIADVPSFAVTVGVICFLCAAGHVRSLYLNIALESNDAITCLTNIIRENKNYTWTICSANDERLMAYDYGYHYELHTLLSEIKDGDEETDITIPTKYVYFFVEKIPLDYLVSYAGSGQSISEEGASRELPVYSSITQYQGENRWIVMSKFYYWAEALRELYPNEMTVYYETDEFICYRLEQNIDNLFNLWVDYDYNY
ncbi:MAG: amino acid ABC transporter permease [Lachnospiraceae bacterium]|nr:amino acid ABC transporter permease [Lachnospiraceae bacterium]